VADTEKTETAVAKYEPRVTALRLTTWAELEHFADYVIESSMVPSSFWDKNTKKPRKADIILAVQFGAEVGLTPMQSLSNIMVTNGRPTVWGDAVPGLVNASGICLYINEWFEGTGDHFRAVCETHRKGRPSPVRAEFSVGDAKMAKLWGKTGYDGKPTPWVTSPRRMLQQRARGFALRDAYPDVLKGLLTTEEVMDYPEDGIIPPAGPAAPSKNGASMPDAIPDADLVDELSQRADKYLAVVTKMRAVDELAKLAARAESMLRDFEAAGRNELVVKVLRAERTREAEIRAAADIADAAPEPAPAPAPTENKVQGEPAHDHETGEINGPDGDLGNPEYTQAATGQEASAP
jgi:hypothetical protein